MLVRGGWDNPDALPRASLQRVEYRLQAGRLDRVGFTHVDGGGAAAVAPLIEDVQRLRAALPRPRRRVACTVGAGRVRPSCRSRSS